MSAQTAIHRSRPGRATAVALGVSAAALSIGYGASVGGAPGPPYLLASLVAVYPVAGGAVMVAERWPRSAALGLLGLLVFGWAFAAGQIARSQTPVPLNVAVLCVVAAGALLVLTHRARWRDVLAGVVLMYTSAAFIFYFSLL